MKGLHCHWSKMTPILQIQKRPPAELQGVLWARAGHPGGWRWVPWLSLQRQGLGLPVLLSRAFHGWALVIVGRVLPYMELTEAWAPGVEAHRSRRNGTFLFLQALAKFKTRKWPESSPQWSVTVLLDVRSQKARQPHNPSGTFRRHTRDLGPAWHLWNGAAPTCPSVGGTWELAMPQNYTLGFFHIFQCFSLCELFSFPCNKTKTGLV